MIQCNIYFGTIGKTLNCKYRYTKNFRTLEEAVVQAKKDATNLYYKNEGKYGLTPYSVISKESEITGIDVETLYERHINDMCRWYAIPTSDDSIPKRKLKW